MKIAILLPGQPRFTNEFNLLLKNLIGYDQADWFCYLTSDNKPSPSPVRNVSDDWKIFDKELGMLKLQNMLPKNNFIRSFEISDCDRVTLPETPWVAAQWGINLYKMYYNLYKVNQLRVNYEQKNNVQYDMVIRARSDIGFRNELDLRKINLDDLKRNMLTPKNKQQWHYTMDVEQKYKICDLFAIGCPEHMDVYCDVIHKLDQYPFTKVENYHSESNLGYHLSINNVSFMPRDITVMFRGDDD